MANIKIMVNGALMDGHKVTFKAPCDCITVEKLNVCYVEDGTQKTRLFTMKDSHGNDLTGLGNLFSKDAYVDVVLDTNNGFAYLQNAGTNAYLEGKITPVDNLLSDRADLPLSARQGKVLNDSLTASDSTKFQFATDGEGNYGYLKGDDTFVPFKSGQKSYRGSTHWWHRPSDGAIQSWSGFYIDTSSYKAMTVTSQSKYLVSVEANIWQSAGTKTFDVSSVDEVSFTVTNNPVDKLPSSNTTLDTTWSITFE